MCAQITIGTVRLRATSAADSATKTGRNLETKRGPPPLIVLQFRIRRDMPITTHVSKINSLFVTCCLMKILALLVWFVGLCCVSGRWRIDVKTDGNTTTVTTFVDVVADAESAQVKLDGYLGQVLKLQRNRAGRYSCATQNSYDVMTLRNRPVGFLRWQE